MTTATIPPSAPQRRRLEVWDSARCLCVIDILDDVVDSAPELVAELRARPLYEALDMLRAWGLSTRPWVPPLSGFGARVPCRAGRYP